MGVGILAGLCSAVFGFGIGSNIRLWKALLLGAIVAFVLAKIPYGILFIEFPIAMMIGGFVPGRKVPQKVPVSRYL
jgi:hypothetical protein